MTWVSKFACKVSIPMRKCCLIVVVTRMKLCKGVFTAKRGAD